MGPLLSPQVNPGTALLVGMKLRRWGGWIYSREKTSNPNPGLLNTGHTGHSTDKPMQAPSPLCPKSYTQDPGLWHIPSPTDLHGGPWRHQTQA